MKQTILIALSLFCINGFSQTEQKFNLDFEVYNPRYLFPKGWDEWGDSSLEADTLIVHSGKYSGKIESKKNDSFGGIAYEIPAHYEGKSMRLEGYMKIKNVENGYGGLSLRVYGSGKMLVSNNMERQNMHGTIDWQKYSITLPYPEGAETIFVAGTMTGKGEAWFDDFVLTIDDKNVQTLKEKEKPIYKASLDKEFELNSKIEFPELNDTLISNLDLLGKIWGFLKYYHPEIGKGNYNWDFELFRVLPKYLEVSSQQDRDQTLLEWVSKYGEINVCNTCKETALDAVLKPDLSWLNAFELNSELKNKLEYIYRNRFQGKHYYIGSGYVGNPSFLNENGYYSMSYKDDGFKLLALYRYWNMIQYFSPNKHLTDKDWNHVLKEYIPKFINSKSKLEYKLSSIELIGDINDTHGFTTLGFANVQNVRGEFYPPFHTQFIDNKLIVTDYYNPELEEVSKVEVGNTITHINNKPIQSIIDSISPYYPASNKAAKMRDITNDILRSNKKEITIDYISNNQKHQHQLPLYIESSLSKSWYKWTGGKCYKLLEGNIGYVDLRFITKTDISIIKDTLKNTKGIIIDIRNYPQTFVPFTLGPYFVSTSRPFVKFTKLNMDNPGEFTFTDALEIPKGKDTYKGKLIVLVNEISQSQSEYTAMAFRAGDNTTIVGSTTAGADGNVSQINLPGGLITYISGIGVYYPDGKETQRVGIIPDVFVKPTIEGIKKGKDELLEKAIEIINE